MPWKWTLVELIVAAPPSPHGGPDGGSHVHLHRVVRTQPVNHVEADHIAPGFTRNVGASTTCPGA